VEDTLPPIMLFERSVITDRHVFVDNCHARL
jgi:hypothetical protein